MFRKVFIGVARSMIGLSDDQIKMLTGKRVKGDMNPYYFGIRNFDEIRKRGMRQMDYRDLIGK